MVVLLFTAGLSPLGEQQSSFGQTPPPDLPVGNLADTDEEKPDAVPKDVTYWVSQLGDEHFLRRQKASQVLKEMGPVIIPELVAAMDTGDLEVIERSIGMIADFALTREPSEDGGAWHTLQTMADNSVGRRGLASRSAMKEVRDSRFQQATQVLTAAGVFLGERNFPISASRESMKVAVIGNEWNGDVKVLQWLKWVGNTGNVHVNGKALRGDVLRHVVKMPNLLAIAMTDGEAGVPDEVFTSLEVMTRIESLEVRYVALTEQQAEIISQLPIRTSLNLMGTGIKKEAVENIKKKLAGLEIQYRQGGFLGVSCYPDEQVCSISRVHENTAAFEAGLLFGDVIVGVGESEVGSFKDLQTAVNLHQAGDEVEVRFRRGGKLLKVKVRLKRLEEN